MITVEYKQVGISDDGIWARFDGNYYRRATPPEAEISAKPSTLNKAQEMPLVETAPVTDGAAERPFQAGDIVRLKAGGFPMTVAARRSSDDLIAVIWMTACGELQRDTISGELLEPATQMPPN